jgi:hypothetical protein
MIVSFLLVKQTQQATAGSVSSQTSLKRSACEFNIYERVRRTRLPNVPDILVSVRPQLSKSPPVRRLAGNTYWSHA